MKYTVDRFENDIVVLENSETLEMIEVKKEILPPSIHEGSILVYENEQYIEDIDEEQRKRKRIEERFKRLRKI